MPAPAGKRIPAELLDMPHQRQLDWGWHTTISDNLVKVGQRLPAAGLSDAEAQIVARRLAQVSDVLATAPRSLRWRARARIGRRVPWYELPEEVD